MPGIVAGDVEISTESDLFPFMIGSKIEINGYTYVTVKDVKTRREKFELTEHSCSKTKHVLTLVREDELNQR